jgi:hypothetical protein
MTNRRPLPLTKFEFIIDGRLALFLIAGTFLLGACVGYLVLR